MNDAFQNIARREAERVLSQRAFGVRVGTVSSYDPATYSVKVILQPEGTPSGWMPIATMCVGDGFGMYVGPTLGDSVLVAFHEGDSEAGVVIGRLPTNEEPPIEVAPGEVVFQTPFGSALKMLASGGASLTSAGGSSVSCDATGTITMTGVAGQTIIMDAAGNIILTPAGSGKVLLGGAGATVPVARNNDVVTGSHVVATSTKVASL